MKSNYILVTGGSGMVGKSLQEILPEADYYSSKELNLLKESTVKFHMRRKKYDTVIHLAAKVGGIIDNINKPAEYFDDNILMNTLLLKSAHKYGVERFIGILSTCIYPDKVDTYPMSEEMLHLGPPTPTNFSYGYAKRSLAVQIDAYNKQYGTKYQYLIPCNLYGEYDKWGENSHFVAALIKKLAEADKANEDTVQLFGTGKPLRQFMYAGDLARVIKHVIDNDITESFNVSVDENLSIHEIAELTRKVYNKICPLRPIKGFEYDSTKPDGQYRKDVSNEKMLSLIPDFKFTSLEEGVKNTIIKVITEL
jgi:GDP-L-fucose synthase